MAKTTSGKALVILLGLLSASCEKGCGNGVDTSGHDDTSETAAPAVCENPSEIELTEGGASGYVRCEDGSVNRVEAVDLDPSHYADRVAECSEDVTPNHGNCSVDSDCGDGVEHQCRFVDAHYQYGCYCEYLCSTDADCPDGQICVAPEAASGVSWPRCVFADCASEGGCASGECGVASKGSQCEPWVYLACRTSGDSCRTNADCGDQQDALCTADDDQENWECKSWYGCD